MYYQGDATNGGNTKSSTATDLAFAFENFTPPLIPLDRVICLDIVLPPRRGLVLKQQEDKRREQLKVWGLRR